MVDAGNFKEPTCVLHFPGVLINYTGLVPGYRFVSCSLAEQGHMGLKRGHMSHGFTVLAYSTLPAQ